MKHYKYYTSAFVTPLQKRPQVWFELLSEIPVAHELFMKMLPENVQIKKIYRGSLLLVYINTENSNSLSNKIFHQNLRWWSVSAPIRWIWVKVINKVIFTIFWWKKTWNPNMSSFGPSVDFFLLYILWKPKHPIFIFCSILW